VARFAAAYIRGLLNVRPVMDRVLEPNDLVRLAGLHPGQTRSHVDLMRHHLQIHAVAGIRIQRLGTMTQNAQFDAPAGAPCAES